MRNSTAMVWLMVWLSAAALALGLAAGTAGGAAAQSARASAGAAGAGFDCLCRYGGRAYAQNACVCMVTPKGARLACCGKVLNNSSWNFTSDLCPSASAPPPAPPAPAAEGASPAHQGYASLSPAGTR